MTAHSYLRWSRTIPAPSWPVCRSCLHHFQRRTANERARSELVQGGGCHGDGWGNTLARQSARNTTFLTPSHRTSVITRRAALRTQCSTHSICGQPWLEDLTSILKVNAKTSECFPSSTPTKSKNHVMPGGCDMVRGH